MSKRIKTNYPGVYYRVAKRIGGKGSEKVYYIVFKKGGKVQEEKVGRQFVDDMTPARAAGIRAERVEGKRLSRKDIRERERAQKEAEANKWTIGRLWEAYKANNPNLKGMPTYESAYNLHIKPNFADKQPKDLLPLDIHRVKNKLLKERSPQTVQHVLEQLRRIINFGVNNRLCRGIDFKIEMPRVDNKKTEDLTPEQLNNLLKAIDKDPHLHAGAMMKVALFTGMRRGEMFKLKWSDVDFERGFINIRDPKGGPDQKIPVNDGVRTILGTLSRNESYVFPGRNGGRRTNIRHQVNRIKKAAGLPEDFRPLHGLRHVYASMLASSGEVDMYTLQKLLTHKDPTMTQRYAHLRDETLKKASDLAGSIIEQAANGTANEKVVNLENHKN
ncbi:MAG: site-specific integrase [Desulfobacterales bacterium]|uniref:Site-specific integrase n=2 Tax=Candidatus Desulfatibia profunda TaxID=2841695 RepID=A0A8J6NU63_9BACT|nr:site-specific integrase [Candidatus Desulfatibia profunda]MBL7180283.1 site-specific integrase [Desulfobacterales bacterium]MBL7208060.1 site-specific integrase [Desulfobacterales bacterium]